MPAEDPALAWYHELVDRIRGTVRDTVPANSTVLVVSRGDDELVRLGNRRGWHFPRQADGRYAGYHPEDSAAAIAHLEDLRVQGARYIVFPASNRWWLEHYEAFADHLNSRYSVVADDEETCTIYALGPHTPATVITDGAQVSPHLTDYVETLLPEDRVAVLRLAESRVSLPGRETVTFPPLHFDGDTAAAIAELDEIAASGVHFLVVPHAIPSWLDEHPGFMVELERRHRRVASQPHVCTVFELRPAELETSQRSRATLFERMRSWLRRAS